MSVKSSELNPELLTMLKASRLAAKQLATATTVKKDEVLERIAQALTEQSAEIIAANADDLARGKEQGIAEALLDRLKLDNDRIAGLATAVRDIIALADPVGEVVRGKTLPNGLKLSQVRVPFGVVGAIYEARPNVTIDIAALALKSGNAAVLRGGRAAESSNRVLVAIIQQALADSGFSAEAVQTIDRFGREGGTELMRARGWVDVLVPRGSASLINTVVTESKVPVIETGDGVVHIFVDESADIDKAVPIILNAKIQRPSVCNALETLLVHEKIAATLLPALGEQLKANSVGLHADEASIGFLPGADAATEADWEAEYLSLELAIRVVSGIDEAIEHIDRYSTGHTDSILTENFAHAEEFLQRVDSAVVMVNASTRFTDGGEFGFGAEVGISTQKLHARGPMGLPELTSSKWQVRGSGQIR